MNNPNDMTQLRKNFWPTLSAHWATAADNKFVLKSEAFQALALTGFDISRLRVWIPTQKEGRRIVHLQNVVELFLTKISSKPECLKEIKNHSNGTGVWEDVRLLIEAHIGTRLPTAVTPTPPTVTPSKETSLQVFLKPPPVFPSADLLSSMMPTANPTLLPMMPTANSTPPPVLPSANPPSPIHRQPVEEDTCVIAQQTPLDHPLTEFSAFLETSDAFTVYLDENWGVLQNTAIQANEGVIAGLICRGTPKTPCALPPIATHCYQNAAQAIAAFTALWKSPEAMPFIFHLTLSARATRHYDELLSTAIRLLCGWLIQPTSPKKLWIYAEAISGHGHPMGDDQTQFYRGLLASEQERYGCWQLQKFAWCDKNFQYTPYADLLAHLSLEHNGRSLGYGQFTRFRTLPGYVPVSVDLLTQLKKMADLDNLMSLDVVIEVALAMNESHFGKQLMRQLRPQFAQSPALQSRLIAALHQRYRDPAADLNGLIRATAAVQFLLPLSEQDTPLLVQLFQQLTAAPTTHGAAAPERLSPSPVGSTTTPNEPTPPRPTSDFPRTFTGLPPTAIASAPSLDRAFMAVQQVIDDPLLALWPTTGYWAVGTRAVLQYQRLLARWPTEKDDST